MADTPTPKPSPKTSDVLRAEYDAAVNKVQNIAKDGHKLEKKLLEEVKAKVKAQAGDLEKAKAQKREAFAAWEVAYERERPDREAAEAATIAKKAEQNAAIKAANAAEARKKAEAELTAANTKVANEIKAAAAAVDPRLKGKS